MKKQLVHQRNVLEEVGLSGLKYSGPLCFHPSDFQFLASQLDVHLPAARRLGAVLPQAERHGGLLSSMPVQLSISQDCRT